MLFRSIYTHMHAFTRGKLKFDPQNPKPNACAVDLYNSVIGMWSYADKKEKGNFWFYSFVALK